MAQIIDITLLNDAMRLLEQMIEKHGIAWFLARDGKKPLMALEDTKVELILSTVLTSRRRKQERVHRDAEDYCRRQIRRDLIRRVAQAMVAAGC